MTSAISGGGRAGALDHGTAGPPDRLRRGAEGRFNDATVQRFNDGIVLHGFPAFSASAMRSIRVAREAFRRSRSPPFTKLLTAAAAESTSGNSSTRLSPAARAA